MRGRPAPGSDIVAELHDLAHRVARLRPCHRRPERFHEERSEIEAARRALAAGALR